MQRELRLSNALLGLFAGVSLLCLLLPLAGPVEAFKTLIAYSVFPGPRAAFWATETMAEVPSNVAGLIRADQENWRLREELRTVELLRARTAALEEENARFRGLLGFPKIQGWTQTWARVMGRSPQSWYREILLDRGSEDGLQVGAPVLAVEEETGPEAVDPSTAAARGASTKPRIGVVGRIIEVTPGASKVLLVTDDLSAVAATVQPGGWEGLVEGEGRAPLKLNYLSEGVNLVPGMEILTSPTSPSFPAGLPLGTVKTVGAADPLLAFQWAVVRPAVRLETLKEVMVLRREGE